jgi:hypothetical protein
VRFRYLDTNGNGAFLVKVFRIRRGRIVMTAVRRDARRPTRVVVYRRTCIPDAARAPAPRAGQYQDGRSLGARFLWATPGGRVAPPVRIAPSVPGSATPVAGASGPPVTSGAPASGPTPGAGAAPRTSWTVLSSGDVANCFNNIPGDPSSGQHPGAGAVLTTNLIKSLLPVDDLIVQGDLAYESGTTAEFRDCYEPTWGQFRAFSHPAPGNHEYGTPGAAGYFAYWGAQAGPGGHGYYSYDLGPWHIVSLNSESDLAAGGAQAKWLRADLAGHATTCTLAFWHKPRFSNDAVHGDDPGVAPLFSILYDNRVDVLLQGHAHVYERWAELAPNGTPAPGRGVRAFVVGTGGAETMAVKANRPGEEVSQGNVNGVLRLTLTSAGYAWSFLPADGSTFSDSGTGTCH